MLKRKLQTLDGLEEAFHGLYEAQEDGSFLLTGVEDFKTQEDVANLQQALGKERNVTKQLKADIKVFDGLDATEVRSNLDELEVLRATEGKVNPEKINSAVEAKLGLIKGPLDAKIKELETANGDLTNKNKEFVELSNRRLIQDEGLEAFRSLELTNSNTQQDVMLHINTQFNVSDDGRVLNKEGLTVNEWLGSMRNKRADWWGVTTGDNGQGGNGSFGGVNPFSREGWNMSEQSKLMGTDRSMAESLAKQAGTTIGGGMPAAKS